MREVYLDNASTTRVGDKPARAAADAMTVCWGNPSSRHSMGVAAESIIKQARAAISAELGAKDGDVYFTSGGTEANNMAILGAARARRKNGLRVITSAVEHASVNDAFTQLEREGFDVVRVKTSPTGVVDLCDVANAIDDQTILCSFMLVNNETGAINPISDISALLHQRRPNAVMHCDAVQGFGKLPVKVSSLGCELITVSGHKIHAPMGVGALYCSRRTTLQPLMFGGSQQRELRTSAPDSYRPGTEPVPLIAAFGEAVRGLPAPAQRLVSIRTLNALLRERLASPSLNEEVNAHMTFNSDEACAPTIFSFATGCIKSETMLNYLSAQGIYVSSGSACSKGKKSRVLEALGLADSIADSTLRISFSAENTEEDVELFCEALRNGLKTLVRFK